MKTRELFQEISELRSEGQRFRDLPGMLEDFQVWLFKLNTMWASRRLRKTNIFEAKPSDARLVLKALDCVARALAEQLEEDEAEATARDQEANTEVSS